MTFISANTHDQYRRLIDEKLKTNTVVQLAVNHFGLLQVRVEQGFYSVTVGNHESLNIDEIHVEDIVGVLDEANVGVNIQEFAANINSSVINKVLDKQYVTILAPKYDSQSNTFSGDWLLPDGTHVSNTFKPIDLIGIVYASKKQSK